MLEADEKAKKLSYFGAWAGSPPTPHVQRNKSFLVLFFKKERLFLIEPKHIILLD